MLRLYERFPKNIPTVVNGSGHNTGRFARIRFERIDTYAMMIARDLTRELTLRVLGRV